MFEGLEQLQPPGSSLSCWPCQFPKQADEFYRRPPQQEQNKWVFNCLAMHNRIQEAHSQMQKAKHDRSCKYSDTQWSIAGAQKEFHSGLRTSKGCHICDFWCQWCINSVCFPSIWESRIQPERRCFCPLGEAKAENDYALVKRTRC